MLNLNPYYFPISFQNIGPTHFELIFVWTLECNLFGGQFQQSSVLSLTHNYCFVPPELTFAPSLSLSMNSLFHHDADQLRRDLGRVFQKNGMKILSFFHFKLMESIQTSKPFFFFFLHFLRKFRMTHTFFFSRKITLAFSVIA